MAFKQKKYIPQGARGWKSKVKVPAWSGEDSLPGQRLLTAFSCRGKSWELSGVPFERVLIPYMRVEPSSPPNTLTLGIRTVVHEF